MRISAKELQQFVGGELEIQNEVEGYLYRGRIKSIADQGTDIAFSFAWQAKNRGAPPVPSPDWDLVVPNKDYIISPEIYAAADIGNGRVSLNSFIVNELAVLFPPNGSAMNPENIQGFPPELMVEQKRRHDTWDGWR